MKLMDGVSFSMMFQRAGFIFSKRCCGVVALNAKLVGK
jgi:hypothetical protein